MIDVVPNRIRHWRMLRRMTQQEVADKLGINVVSYNKLEKGKNDLSLRRIQQIGDALDVDPTAFFTDIADSRSIPVICGFAVNRFVSKFVRSEEEHYNIFLKDVNDYKNINLYAGEVEDDSMNTLLPKKTIVVIVPLDFLKGEMQRNKLYHIERLGEDGKSEHSIKVLKEGQHNRLWLTSASDNPVYSGAIPFANENEKTIFVKGRVIFSIKPE